MTIDGRNLRPADSDSAVDASAVALCFDGRRRVHHAGQVMARVTAGRLVECLVADLYVILKREGGVAPTTSGMPTPHRQ